jgi:class 3 adenylate cyclase
LAIRAGFKSRNNGATTVLGVRIGLAAGEPVDRNGDLFGSTVNLASRLCAAAEPDTILVSDVVCRLGSATGFVFTEADERTLKGFAHAVRAFELQGAEA